MKTKQDLKQEFYMKGVENSFHQLMKHRAEQMKIITKEQVRMISKSLLSEDYIDILVELLDETGYFNSQEIIDQIQKMKFEETKQLND